ncbi:hypothetical protein JZU57_02665, partial [bacterium]|nr:hypothetical protein [bacterium]
KNGNATDANVVALVTELAKGWSDGYIASMLNRSGLLTGKGNSWNETRVRNLRRENDIPVFSKSGPRAWKTMLEASTLLGVSNCVVRTMIRNKILPARQIAKCAPWMIDDTDLVAAVEMARSAGLELGKDMGILSYNESPVKRVIDKGITVISTDFAEQGRQAA